MFPANEKGKQNRFMCGYQGCKKRPCFDGITRRRHWEKCPCKANCEIHYSNNTAKGEMNVDHAVSSDPAEDYKFNYSCKLLGDGLLELTRKDASREGDGSRLFVHWKYDFVSFTATGRTTYAYVAFYLVAQIEFLLSERKAAQLMHNRSVNFYGG